MLALLVLFSAFTAHSAPEVIAARAAESLSTTMGVVMNGVIPVPAACAAAPPMACGGLDLIGNYNPSHYRGNHGQIFFGEGPFYISHLPLLSRPHNFQAIYEVDFPDTDVGRAAKALYLARADRGFASFQPGEYWSYPDFDCSIDSTRRELEPGRLHQGQFEDGGSYIARTALVIKRRIFFRIWPEGSLPEVTGDAQAKSEYIVFGENNQFFTARVITSVPGIDHIQPVPPAPFRALVGGANHACYDVGRNNGTMLFTQKKCADPSAPLPYGSTEGRGPLAVSFNPFYVETEDLSP